MFYKLVFDGGKGSLECFYSKLWVVVAGSCHMMYKGESRRKNERRGVHVP
jgi:hypothetical protein